MHMFVQIIEHNVFRHFRLRLTHRCMCIYVCRVYIYKCNIFEIFTYGFKDMWIQRYIVFGYIVVACLDSLILYIQR